MDTPHITEEQADEFAIGAMEPPLAAFVSLHASDCAECGRRLAASREAAAALFAGLPRARPPARLRKRTLRATGILSPGPLTWAARIATASAGLAAVFIAIAAFTGMVSIRGQVRDLRDENARLDSEVSDLRSQEVQIAALTQEVEDQRRRNLELQLAGEGNRDLLVAMLSPGAGIAEVFPVGDRTRAIGRFVWDPSQRKAYFIAAGLEPLRDGRTYQLWVNASGRFQSLGVFNSDDAGFARFVTLVPEGVDTYESALVTIEKPGAEEREGPSVFVADLAALRR